MKNPLLLSLFLLLSYLSFSQPGNDLCASAVTLAVGADCSHTAGTLYNTTMTTVTGPGNCGTRSDVWYRFTVPANSTTVRITVSLTSSPSTLSTTNTFIETLNGNSCPTVSTSTGSCNNISSPRAYGGLTPGATYLFRLYTTSGVTGTSTSYNFNICVTSNDDCVTASTITPGSTSDGSMFGASPTSTIPVGCATGNPDDDVWYKFTAVYSYATIVVHNAGSDLSSSGVRTQLFQAVAVL